MRSASASISLTVTPFTTPPTGVTSATPNSLLPGASTLLTVSVTPGTNPSSTGITVAADLSSIGGSASQQFFDDGSHGDASAGDNIFSFSSTVTSDTTPGSKSLPVTIADAQARTSTPSIALNVQFPAPPTTVKISQAYGGGGNSGSTYKNDFIEIFNQASTSVDVSTWSVQYASAGQTNWQMTPLCTNAPCTIAPGHYFLVLESQGLSGTTNLPTPDASGAISMGAGSAQVALVETTGLLTGICPTGGGIVDFVGYGTSGCPNPMSAALTNTTAAIRKGNGCIDTHNNGNDLLIDGPIPRNSSAPPNSCAINPAQITGQGIATPDLIENTAMTLLTVKITPATTPPSTSLGIVADLTALGGSSSQQFFDDGTHGDLTAGDNTFSVLATIGAAIPTGAKFLAAHVTDGQARSIDIPLTVTVQSPTCGVEYWNVKTGIDADATTINLTNVTPISISDLRAIPIAFPPIGDRPTVNNAATRIAPTEFTVYRVNATLTLYKLETDVDYHMVLQDENGNTIVSEIPSPACVGAQSPFLPGITTSRATMDAHLSPTEGFQAANLPVRITGVGFFDVLHGQTGIPPNGIEIHPILDLEFTNQSSTQLISSLNPSQSGQAVTFTATVGNGGVSTPTGNVTFLDGATQLATIGLDGTGHASVTTSSLSIGQHSITASYEGDTKSTPSKSSALVQNVNPVLQTISIAAPMTSVITGTVEQLTATGHYSDNTTADLTNSASWMSSATGVATVSSTGLLTATGAGSTTITATSAGISGTVGITSAAPVYLLRATPAPITKDGSGNFIVQLTFVNQGNATLTNIGLTLAKLNSTSIAAPSPIASLAPGASQIVTLTFPPTSGASPSNGALSTAGSCTGIIPGGPSQHVSLTANFRIALP